jgi:hypothetical protein
MTIPIRQQRLSRDFVETIKFDQARGEAVPGEDLLRATEQRMGPLPQDLRELFRAFSIPAVKRRGRRTKTPAEVGFSFEELDRRYSKLCRQFRQEPRRSATRSGSSPSEQAYEQLAREMSKVFDNISPLALKNKHSAWRTILRKGRVGSEDFEAEIERQFPAHK